MITGDGLVNCRWSDVDGFVPGEILPVGVQEAEGRRFHQPVLQIRQRDAYYVHVVAVPGGAGVVAGGVDGDQEAREEAFDALRRYPVLRRSSHQWLRSGRLDAHCWPYLPRFRNWICQSGSSLSPTFFN